MSEERPDYHKMREIFIICKVVCKLFVFHFLNMFFIKEIFIKKLIRRVKEDQLSLFRMKKGIIIQNFCQNFISQTPYPLPTYLKYKIIALIFLFLIYVCEYELI